MFKKNYVGCLKIAKPPWCLPIHGGLSNTTKRKVGGTMVLLNINYSIICVS